MPPNEWTNSSYCSNNGCITTRIDTRQPGMVQIKDSKQGDHSPILTIHPTQWAAFIDAVKAGSIRP